MARPFLELKNVSKRFGPNEVLRDVNLSVSEGEFVAIVGYSGSGKTTLVNLIAGLLTPDSGQVLLNGTGIAGPGPDRGVVFQNYSLLPWLTVAENIALAVDRVNPNWPAARRREHVAKNIALVNLSAAAGKRPAELSGGMKQRVAVARALAMDPKILLLDEPLSALDALTRATLQDEIERLRGESGKTILLITNDVDEGILLADRIIPLSAGPGATLGPAVAVEISRPRDRKLLNTQTDYHAIRREVLGYLLGPGGRRAVKVSRLLVLPEIEPDDLDSKFPGTPRPLRAREVHREEMNIGL